MTVAPVPKPVKPSVPLTRSALVARATFTAEWLKAGRIDAKEAARLEVDAVLGHDSGPVRWTRR